MSRLLVMGCFIGGVVGLLGWMLHSAGASKSLRLVLARRLTRHNRARRARTSSAIGPVENSHAQLSSLLYGPEDDAAGGGRGAAGEEVRKRSLARVWASAAAASHLEAQLSEERRRVAELRRTLDGVMERQRLLESERALGIAQYGLKRVADGGVGGGGGKSAASKRCNSSAPASADAASRTQTKRSTLRRQASNMFGWDEDDAHSIARPGRESIRSSIRLRSDKTLVDGAGNGTTDGMARPQQHDASPDVLRRAAAAPASATDGSIQQEKARLEHLRQQAARMIQKQAKAHRRVSAHEMPPPQSSEANEVLLKQEQDGAAPAASPSTAPNAVPTAAPAAAASAPVGSDASPSSAEGGPAATAAPAPAAADEHGWSAAQFVESQLLHEAVAEALLAPILHLHPPSLAQFAYCKGLSREQLRQLLRSDGEAVLDRIEERLWAGLGKLQGAAAASGAELSAKFATDADYMLEYGNLGVFYSGLEHLLGAPSMNPLEGMEREHCRDDDADEPFATSNGMTTTSREEFEFVVRPQLGKAYPDRADVMLNPKLRRKPLPPEAFDEVRRQKNALLRAAGHSELMREEQIAGRLYTGPVYEKLNAVLRALSGNAFLKRKFEVLCRGNTYATTIHAVSSCVLKLSKLTKATKVYRGLKGAALPSSFFTPDAQGVCGGVEFGFTSTSGMQAEALAYAVSSASDGGGGAPACPILLEMDQGMVSRGASMEDFSQYPHEREVLFSPLLGVEVLGSRVEGSVLVVQLRVTVNVTALTLEQQLSKRRRLVQQMCDNIRNELKADLALPEWEGMAELRGPAQRSGGASSSVEQFEDGHAHAQGTLRAEMEAASSEQPEYYNDDQAWGNAIARAVAASHQVGLWPGGLKKLCALAKLEPAALLHAPKLIFNWRELGRAEAEVLELLLRVAPSLNALTLHDGGMGAGWAPSEWDLCVAAIARGLSASRSLSTLNLRHFSLRGAAGDAMAAALRDHPSITTLRLARNGLAAEALEAMVRGRGTQRRLRTLSVIDNPMPSAELKEVARLGAGPSLVDLSLVKCELGDVAAPQLVEMVRLSTAQRHGLADLDLQNNALSAAFARQLVEALDGSSVLRHVKYANNPLIDAAASESLHNALAAVQKRWAQTAEGKAHAKKMEQEQSQSGRVAGMLGQAAEGVGGVLNGLFKALG